MQNGMNAGMDRRNFLRRAALGGAGVVGIGSLAGCSSVAQVSNTGLRAAPVTDTSDVTFVVNTDQREAAYQALKPLQSQIEREIGDKQVVIKINAGQVTKDVWLNATDPNFTRGILDFLGEFYDRKIIITESTAASTTVFEGFENYGFTEVANEYNVELTEMNAEPYTPLWVLDNAMHPQEVNVLNPYLDPNVYMISPTRLKTHNNVIATLSLKNVAMGAPVNHFRQASARGRNEKPKMHAGGNRGLSYNLFRLASFGVRPDLAVLDGVVGMEGDGPVRGTPVEQGVTIASTDFVAADRLGVELMGVDYEMVRYLQWCSEAGMGNDDLEKINIIGPDYTPHITKYKMHSNIDSQYQWVIQDYQS